MNEQREITTKGGTMRLGSYPCVLVEGTMAAEAYGAAEITERHRHRYEVNNDFREQLEQQGMMLSGLSPDKKLVEMIELRRSSVLRRLPVPPRVQVAADDAAPAVPPLRRAACSSTRRWRDETAPRRLGPQSPTPAVRN